jgi:DNA-binding MarR family transcriptional regulator
MSMVPSRTDRLSEACARVAAECACGGLRRAARAISKVYESALAPLDLTATQLSILVAVHRRGPVPLSRLAEALVLDRTTLYRAVKPLVRRRCLRIAPGRNRRERTAALSEAGRRLLEAAFPIWETVQDRFVGALGPQAWTALTSGLPEVVPTAQRLGSGARASAASRRPAVQRP